jgi:hypothetical protein
MNRLIWLNRLLLAAALLLGGYYVWSFFVSSRYQALCGGSYWQLSPAQIESCKDLKSQLDNK